MQKFIEKAQQDSTVMWLLLAVSALIGLLLGIVCSPVKNGISIGNNNTLVGDNNACDDDDDEDERGKCCRGRKKQESKIMKF